MHDQRLDEIAKLLVQPSTIPLPRLNQHLLTLLSVTDEVVNMIGNRWREESLATATSSEDSSRADDYVRPLITLAELLRRRGYAALAQKVYESGMEFVERECDHRGIELHKGAIFANLAITHLEAQRYSEGMAWLYSAAQEDKRTYQIDRLQESYALSADGILGQWLDGVLAKSPTSLLAFLNANLTKAVTQADLKDFCLWLASVGDLRFASSIAEYERVRPYTDLHSSSVRLNVLRELSGLFEVLLRRLGLAHKDPACAAAFRKPPSLAALLCHMHYRENPEKRSKNPALRRNKKVGLFWNNIQRNDQLVDAIDGQIANCKGPLATVWAWLDSTQLSRNPRVDEPARRYLLAYKLRNETAHNYEPDDPTLRALHGPLFEWLLQANGLLYFSTLQTRQVSL